MNSPIENLGIVGEIAGQSPGEIDRLIELVERDCAAYSRQSQISFEPPDCDAWQILFEVRERLLALAGFAKAHPEIEMSLQQAWFKFQRLPQRLHCITRTAGGIARDPKVQVIFSDTGGNLHQLLITTDCRFPILLVVSALSRPGRLVNAALFYCAGSMRGARFTGPLSGKSIRGNKHQRNQGDDLRESR